MTAPRRARNCRTLVGRQDRLQGDRGRTALSNDRAAARHACRRRSREDRRCARRSRLILPSGKSRTSSSRASSTMRAPTGSIANIVSPWSTANPMPATWRSPIAGTSGISTPSWHSARRSAPRKPSSCSTSTMRSRRATRHALDEMSRRVGLDYFIVDCAENQNGELLVFEADNTAVVHNMDPPAVFPYKPPQMRKIFAAFTAMLSRHARRRARRAQHERDHPQRAKLRHAHIARSAGLERVPRARPIACSTR